MSLIALAKIRTDGGTQPRAAIDFEAVDDYTDAMLSGTKFPPVTVFYDGSEYWLADGFHRRNAAFAANLEQIDCDVRQGTRDDAQWYSFSANKTNGLRRTNEDKQRAVKAALVHPGGAGKSDHQIAKWVGVAVSCVGDWRRKLGLTVVNLQSGVRTGSDGRTINTANIGRQSYKSDPVAPLTTQADAGTALVSPPHAAPVSIASRTVPIAPQLNIPVAPEPPPANLPEPLSRERVWAAQETKHFTKELLRLLRQYEKTHELVRSILIVRNGGVPIGIEVEWCKEELL